MRILFPAIVMLLLGGCAAMMVGGANSGGYKPPADQCVEGDEREKCKS